MGRAIITPMDPVMVVGEAQISSAAEEIQYPPEAAMELIEKFDSPSAAAAGVRGMLERKDKIAIVTIHRPEKRNALSPEVLEEIEILFGGISKMEDVNVVVFTGGEKYFSAGFDLNFIRTIKKETNEEFKLLLNN